MKQILLMIAVVALVGCGKKEPFQPTMPNPEATQPTTPNPEATNTEATKPEPTKPEPTKAKATAGVKLWEFETGRAVHSSPAIGSDGTVYVGSFDKSSMPSMARVGASYGNLKRNADWNPPPPSDLMARFTSGRAGGAVKSSMPSRPIPKA
jgi:hypothetical protein